MGDAERFKRYEQGQGVLLPAFVSDALAPSDPAFFINDVVESLDLSRFVARYAVDGEHAYAPQLLLKLWLYAATQGVYSGREIARRLRRDLGFRYLGGTGAAPDFRTINRFRARHREDFVWVLRATVDLARRAGMAQLGVVTVDGTKLRANTSRHKAMSYGRMRKEEARLEAEVQTILQRMDEVHQREEQEHGTDGDGSGGLPAALQDRTARLAKIRALRTQLEAERGAKIQDRHQKSFADPEAQMMKTGDGALVYAYNAQAAVSADGLILATGLTPTVRDHEQLLPMLDTVEQHTTVRPDTVLADNGYLTEANLAALLARHQRGLLGLGREFHRPKRWPRQPLTQRMHRLLRLPWARALYARRKTQGERPFAEVKQAMGFRRCMLRGTVKVRGEWNLVAAAFNLRRLRAMGLVVA
ncbi:MAG: transposase [Candidatus Binatia bacterium]